MQGKSINAETRTETGKGSNNRLRQNGYIPAVMYSKGDSEVLQVKKKDFSDLFKGHIQESVLIDVNIANGKDAESPKVFIKDYQLDPITDEVIHLDMYRITIGEKITTRVNVEVIGKSEGEKLGGILEVMERELEIECLPLELPEKVTIDVTSYNIGDSFCIKDLETPGSLKFLGDPEQVIVAVLIPHMPEEEEEVEEEEGIEGEEGEVAEGAEDAEGKTEDKDKKEKE